MSQISDDSRPITVLQPFLDRFHLFSHGTANKLYIYIYFFCKGLWSCTKKVELLVLYDKTM
jgi:hypothetical protein